MTISQFHELSLTIGASVVGGKTIEREWSKNVFPCDVNRI